MKTGKETLVLDVVVSESLLDENPILVMFAKKSALIAIPCIAANASPFTLA